MGEQQTFTLPAGTVCKRNGIPFALEHSTPINCLPANWELIRDDFKPSIDGRALVSSSPAMNSDEPRTLSITQMRDGSVHIEVGEHTSMTLTADEYHTMATAMSMSHKRVVG